jgi:AraC-like DNA-binding protein
MPDQKDVWTVQQATMVVKEYPASGMLANYVRSYMLVSSKEESMNIVLPDTSPMMVFLYKGKFRYAMRSHFIDMPAVALAGLRSCVKEVKLGSDTGVFVVKFKELAFSSFFREPLHFFFETRVSGEDLPFGKRISGIEGRLLEAGTDEERIDVVERSLESLFQEKHKDRLIEAALHRIRAANGNVRIKELVRSLYVSLDVFEKRFRESVGVSPKKFSTIIKMNYAVKNGLVGQSITDMALNLGYFDDSHFIRDFRYFSGRTPYQYFRSG